MGLSVIPTNIGGVSLNSALSPLAALLAPTNNLQNLMYPSDLGSNPAMGHAIIFQAYDRTTALQKNASVLGNVLSTALSSVQSSSGIIGTLQALGSAAISAGSSLASVAETISQEIGRAHV